MWWDFYELNSSCNSLWDSNPRKGSFNRIRQDLGYRVDIWDTREVVEFPYLDIFKKIVGGSLSGTVCAMFYLKTRVNWISMSYTVSEDLPEDGPRVLLCSFPGAVLSSRASERWAAGVCRGQQRGCVSESSTRRWGKGRNRGPQPLGARLGQARRAHSPACSCHRQHFRAPAVACWWCHFLFLGSCQCSLTWLSLAHTYSSSGIELWGF